ncbi:MAG: alpha/beta hydrolase-fold protein, partial [Candidatus Nanopelagicales bacterium]
MDIAAIGVGAAGDLATMIGAASAGGSDGQPENLRERLLFKIELIPVTSIWWVVGFGVAALFFLALCVYVRPKKWMILFVPLVVLMASLAVGFGVNIKFRAYTTLGPMLGLDLYETGDGGLIEKPEGTYPRGVVVDAKIPGRVSGLGELPAKVWLPPQWFSEPSRTFPVIYLLHGVPGFAVPGLDPNSGPGTLFTSANADNGAQIAATQRDQPVVLVAPVNSPMNADTECVDGSQGKWQTYLATDLTNWVAAHPRMQKGPEHSAIS